jgi:hypothetical protein
MSTYSTHDTDLSPVKGRGTSPEPPTEEGKEIRTTREPLGFNVQSISVDVLRQIYEKVSIKPTGLTEMNNKELTNFSLLYDEKTGIPTSIFLPSNVEAFADNWIMIVAVCAVTRLNLKVLPGPALDKLEYPKESSQYFHGIAAALRQMCDTGSVKYQSCSGSFRQGWMWSIAHADVLQKNPKFFRLSWKHPREVRVGKTIWGFEKDPNLKRWLTLVNIACKTIVLDKPEMFALSFDRLKDTIFKTSWSFEKGGVFDEAERKAMLSSVQEELNAYNSWVESHRNLTLELMENYNSSLASFKSLFEYNNSIGIIGTYRATYLYSASMKKKTSKGVWTLSSRRGLLNVVEWIHATNPTGLIRGDTRVTVDIPKGANWDSPDTGIDSLTDFVKRNQLTMLAQEWADRAISYFQSQAKE